MTIFFDVSTDVRRSRKLTGKLLNNRFLRHRTFFEANFFGILYNFCAKTFGRNFFVMWHLSRSQIPVWPSFKAEDLRTWKYSYLLRFLTEIAWMFSSTNFHGSIYGITRHPLKINKIWSFIYSLAVGCKNPFDDLK